jgi:acylaminoacyl-peptidase
MRLNRCFCAGAFSAALLFSYPAALRAQESSNKLTALDEFQIQLPTDPQISPDGKKIVYVRGFADPMTDRRYGNLWIINADGTDHRALTTGNHGDSSPRWSPDAPRLSFRRRRQAANLHSLDGLRPNRAHHQPRTIAQRHRLVA